MGEEGEQVLQLPVHEQVEEPVHRPLPSVLVHDLPRHEVVLSRLLAQPRFHTLLLERPHVQEHATARVAHADQVLDRLQLPVLVGQVLQHGHAQHAVHAPRSIHEAPIERPPQREMRDGVLHEVACVGIGVLAHRQHLAAVVLTQDEVARRGVCRAVLQVFADVLAVAAARVEQHGYGQEATGLLPCRKLSMKAFTGLKYLVVEVVT